MRTLTILLASLMLTMTLSPAISAEISKVEFDSKDDNNDLDFEIPIHSIDEIGPRKSNSGTSGRAPCNAVQTDAGSAGDTGNTTSTAKSLGTDPTNGPTGVTGCVDSSDSQDLYGITTSAGKDVDIELVVPANADFDLYIVDSSYSGSFNEWYLYDYSEYNDPLEKVSTGSTNLSGQAITFYVLINAYSGDGQYTLRVWTNNSVPKPDIVITTVEGPDKAQAGDTVNVNYTVENTANNSTANTGPFDVFFILSTDQTYDIYDEILNDVYNEADLAAGASRNTSASVTIPVNMTNGTYYWLVWADGYDNVTESNNSNNNFWTNNQTVIGKDCADLVGGTQNDGGIGSDAASDMANATNMGNNVTATYTGCMDGGDGDDIFAFDVPSGYFIEISLDVEDQNSDLDLYIHYSNGTEVDRGYTSSYPETATAKLTDYEGMGGTYYVNVSHWSGLTNYTLDVWTNVSIPGPDYEIESVTGAASGQPGSNFDVFAQLANIGNLDDNGSVELVAILSVNTGVEWYDDRIGSVSVNGLSMDTNQSITIPATIPQNIVEGEYYLYVEVDPENLVDERNEENNLALRNGQFTIGNEETGCPQQNDAGMGSDAGNTAGNELDLGQYSDAEYRGCVDSNDVGDYYTISVGSGEILNITVVDPPNGAVNVALLDSNGEQVDSDTSWNSDSEVTTFDTNWSGVAGTYTIHVNRSNSWFEAAGTGTYRLIFGEPAGWVAPFSCLGHSDVGIGIDAGTGIEDPMELGNNPDVLGQGCLSDQDEFDAYRFSMIENKNFEINFTADPGTTFVATLYDGEMNQIMDFNSSMWTTMDNPTFEGTDSTYTLLVDSQNSEGFYNLSLVTMPAAPADFAVSNLSCGDEMVSGNELFYSFDIHNLRGPAIGDFSWELILIDDNYTMVEVIDTATQATYANYGQTVLQRGSSYFIDAEMPSGTYQCSIIVNFDMAIMEINVENNEMLGDEFYIQNEEELWANDIDRDGYNTSDTGDGIVDDCPTSYGESWGDRYGCADLDGDGWSNAGDFSAMDPSQWLDEDEDGFGDNSTGYLGDQCPGVYGVPNGEGGDGCPPPFIDSDGDGIQDSEDDCPDTVTGATVNPEDGCEIDTDGDGVVDSQDDCPATEVGVAVNPVDGCEVIDNSGGDDNNDGGDDNNDGGDDNSDTSDKTSDSTQSGTDWVMYGGIGGGVILILILSLLFIRKGRGSDEDNFVNAAFNETPGVDPSITPEQLQYEQQLIAAGYPADYARQYADQHFRPWLNQ